MTKPFQGYWPAKAFGNGLCAGRGSPDGPRSSWATPSLHCGLSAEMVRGDQKIAGLPDPFAVASPHGERHSRTTATPSVCNSPGNPLRSTACRRNSSIGSLWAFSWSGQSCSGLDQFLPRGPTGAEQYKLAWRSAIDVIVPVRRAYSLRITYSIFSLWEGPSLSEPPRMQNRFMLIRTQCLREDFGSYSKEIMVV